MSRDIEETRKMHQNMRDMEVLVKKIEDITVGQTAYLVLGALTSSLGRVMHQTKTPVESVAHGLSLILEMCAEQDKENRGEKTDGNDT
jgi:hypothetical protein